MLEELKNKITELAKEYKALRTSAPVVAAKSISAAVGAGGKNVRADVLLVQQLLNAKNNAKLAEDGGIGPATIAAIAAFQKQIFNGWSDGKIDVGGTTWQKLSGSTSAQTPVETPKDTIKTPIETPEETPTKDEQPAKLSDGGSIKKGVGKGQPNEANDVYKVQLLMKYKPADSKYTPEFEAAIGKLTSDFVISPKGGTVAKLMIAALPALGKPADVEAKSTKRPTITQKGGAKYEQEIVVAAGKSMTAASPVLVIVGGMHGHGGKEMISYTPSSLFAKAVIIGAGYGDKWADISAQYQAKFGVALSPSKCSVCGYSAGGVIETWAEFNSFKKVGLIDTFIYGKKLSNKVIGSWNFQFWQSKDPVGFIKRAKIEGAQVEETGIDHFSYVQYFLSQFGGDLV